jgi:DNA-binding HxlR family transcriptional regulator
LRGQKTAQTLRIFGEQRVGGSKVKGKQGCPVQATVAVVRGKWKVSILWNLAFGPKRFAELARRLAKISEKVLTAQLRQLEHDGVISRTVTAGAPPKVSYSLTAAGLELVKLMQGLCDWGSEHFGIRPTMGTPPFLLNQAVQNQAAEP